MAKRSERAKARMERKRTGLDKKTKRLEEQKAQAALGAVSKRRLGQNISVTFTVDGAAAKEWEAQLEVMLDKIQRRDKRYRLTIDTN